jgi:phosphoribosyl-ATP pyrophosphohydrolase
MNGYTLIRAWYNFKFANPSKAKAIHSDLFCYLVDKWNRLGQKKEFGLPTSVTMELMGIGSYNTYKKTLYDLVDFGFIKIVKESKNQHNSKIVALSKIDKATDEALDKATDEATDTIIEQKNKRNIEERKQEFAQDMVNFSGMYKREMMVDFYEYWTEHGKNDKKMRFEKQASFDLGRRLKTWERNQKPEQDEHHDPLVEYVKKQLGDKYKS